jgi:hypothetical protein
MASKATASQIGVDVIESARRDREWRHGFTWPLPQWFRGAHLAGLPEYERRARFDEMSRRALARPVWLVVALLASAAITIPCLVFARLPIVAVCMWPAAAVLTARHYAQRRQFKLDARAAGSVEP